MAQLSIRDSIQVLEQWEKILEVSFGPHARAVFILDSCGTPRLTCKGWDLVMTLGTRYPVAKLLLGTLGKVQESLGDGTKSFVFLVLDMCRELLRRTGEGPSSRISVCVELSQAEVGLLPALSSHLEGMAQKSSLWQNLIRTCLRSQFPETVSRTLGDLMCEFLGEASPDIDHVTQLIRDFPNWCVEVDGCSVSESKVLNGVVLTREIVVDPPEDIQGSHFVVWKLPESSGEPEGVIFATTKEVVKEAVGWETKRTQSFLRRHRQMGVRFIVSSKVLPGYFPFLCRTEGLTAVVGVAPEEVDYLLRQAEITPVENLQEDLTPQHLGRLLQLQTMLVGTQHKGTLLTPNLTSRQIQICGASKELCGQYSRACCDCLKVIRLWCEGGGQVLAGNRWAEIFVTNMAGDFPLVAPALLQAFMGIERRLRRNSGRSCEDQDGLEPLLLKKCLLEYVFRAVGLVFRTETVCSVRGRLHPKSKVQNADEDDDDDNHL